MDILTYSLQPTLLFEDKEAADKILRSLQSDNSINRVRVYKSDGREFTAFIRVDRDGNIKLAKDIVYDRKSIGRLEVQSVYSGMEEKYMTYLLISLLIIIISIPASYIISAPLRSQVSDAVAQLVKTLEDLKKETEVREKNEQELKNTLQELERFNEAAVGREERMVELKKEINHLSKELGRNPPYNLSFTEAKEELS